MKRSDQAVAEASGWKICNLVAIDRHVQVTQDSEFGVTLPEKSCSVVRYRKTLFLKNCSRMPVFSGVRIASAVFLDAGGACQTAAPQLDSLFDSVFA